ncbi:MAG: sigma-70 family RNA polymerase sigma factor [Planctomycetes bacterium]|nr:sigma-70 family RNA polymerase sigma factor [Planctomycetota bacterium]
MHETSLSLLDRACRREDADAWDRLAGLYAPLLRGWLRRLGVQDSDADDLTQEVLLVVMRELPAFEHNRRPGAFRRWLRMILVHRVRDFWKRRRRWPAATGATSFQEQLDQLADDEAELSRQWEREHDEHVMDQLIESVRPRFAPQTWQAFHLQVMEGRRADDVAEELDLSLSSVYVAKSRILAALRREADGLID